MEKEEIKTEAEKVTAEVEKTAEQLQQELQETLANAEVKAKELAEMADTKVSEAARVVTAKVQELEEQANKELANAQKEADTFTDKLVVFFNEHGTTVKEYAIGAVILLVALFTIPNIFLAAFISIILFNQLVSMDDQQKLHDKIKEVLNDIK